MPRAHGSKLEDNEEASSQCERTMVILGALVSVLGATSNKTSQPGAGTRTGGNKANNGGEHQARVCSCRRQSQAGIHPRLSLAGGGTGIRWSLSIHDKVPGSHGREGPASLKGWVGCQGPGQAGGS